MCEPLLERFSGHCSLGMPCLHRVQPPTAAGPPLPNGAAVPCAETTGCEPQGPVLCSTPCRDLCSPGRLFPVPSGESLSPVCLPLRGSHLLLWIRATSVPGSRWLDHSVRISTPVSPTLLLLGDTRDDADCLSVLTGCAILAVFGVSLSDGAREGWRTPQVLPLQHSHGLHGGESRGVHMQ